MALDWQALEPDFGLTPLAPCGRGAGGEGCVGRSAGFTPLPSPLPQGERGHKARGKQPPWPYFKLMVVFTPWPAVLSSNQRAVTVLVWV
jgi:hypothetical protein